MSAKFSDRVAFVTGGSSGIGRATALALGREGARVVLASRGTEAGEETVREIQQKGGEASFIRCDVSRADDVRTAVDGVLHTHGRLDMAVNSAGVFDFTGPTAECREDDWDRIVDTNLKGVWLSMRAEIPPMVDQGQGAIVNVAGAFGLIGFSGIPAYVAAKHGVVGLTKAASLEYAKTGVRINAICPGVTHTPMVERATGNDPEVEAQFSSQMPIGRSASPEEVAAAILWMCSNDASFLLGHSLALDGGWVAQ